MRLPSNAPPASLPILGRRLHALNADKPLRQWLQAFWSFPEYALPWCTEGLREIWLEAVPANAVTPPDRPLQVLEVVGGQITMQAADPHFFLGTSSCGASLEIADEHAHIRVWGSHEARFTALHLALIEAVRVSGLLPLHASVVSRAGATKAFLGPSGRGKSTTLMRALEAGYEVIAEDFAWLEPSSFTVYGWDKGVRLRPNTLASFERVIAQPNWAIRQDLIGGKHFIPYAALGQHGARYGQLTELVWLERHADQDSLWLPLAKRNAVVRLWEACGLPLSGRARQHAAQVFPHLLATLPMKRLNLGRTPLPW